MDIVLHLILLIPLVTFDPLEMVVIRGRVNVQGDKLSK